MGSKDLWKLIRIENEAPLNLIRKKIDLSYLNDGGKGDLDKKLNERNISYKQNHKKHKS